jgi:hypothetical protein
MFIRIDPNNSNPPDYDVIDSDATLAGLLANTVYNDCSAGPGMMRYPRAVYRQSQDVTCSNLPLNPLSTDIYEV